MPEMHATVSTSVIDESGPEPVMHVRCWEVPAEWAADFAVVLTATCGQPDEMVADPRVMARNGQRSAEEDGTVYLIREAGDG